MTVYLSNLSENIDKYGKLLSEKFGCNVVLQSLGKRELVDEKVHITVYLDKKTDPFFFFLSTFPGQCSWLILYHLPDIENTKLALQIAEKICEIFLYKVLILSLASHQKGGRDKILEECGYDLLLENKNKHSGFQVYMYAKELEKKEEKELNVNQ